MASLQEQYRLSALDRLEAESMHILRETAASFERPILLYSIGKDSSVLLHLAAKAFAPGKLPFPLLHVNTGFKFAEMIAFRDARVAELGIELIEAKNTEDIAMNMTADQAATDQYIYYKKTKPLLEALADHNCDAAIGGARRDEEKARAKERIFSYRDEHGVWDPKSQRPELWHTYNTRIGVGESVRVFPLSNWTEMDIWLYIKREQIPIVPLYFAHEEDVVTRDGHLYRLDEHVKLKDGETSEKMMIRYRTLGCSPSTSAVPSNATNLDDIIAELKESKHSERQGRAIDKSSSAAMENKKREGYF